MTYFLRSANALLIIQVYSCVTQQAMVNPKLCYAPGYIMLEIYVNNC